MSPRRRSPPELERHKREARARKVVANVIAAYCRESGSRDMRREVHHEFAISRSTANARNNGMSRSAQSKRVWSTTRARRRRRRTPGGGRCAVAARPGAQPEPPRRRNAFGPRAQGEHGPELPLARAKRSSAAAAQSSTDMWSPKVPCAAQRARPRQRRPPRASRMMSRSGERMASRSAQAQHLSTAARNESGAPTCRNAASADGMNACIGPAMRDAIVADSTRKSLALGSHTWPRKVSNERQWIP